MSCLARSSLVWAMMTLVLAAVLLPAAPAQESLPEAPFLGINLEGTMDWQRQHLFVDAMKQSRGWGTPRTPWDLAAPVDELGWPTADAGIVVISNGVALEGTYRLSFRGRANVTSLDRAATVQNPSYDPATDLSTAEVVVDATARGISLSFTATQGGVRQVRLIRPGYRDGELFTRPFLELIRPFSCLRVMQYAATNGNWTPATGNMVANWSDRTRPEHATQNRHFQGAYAGAAWEYAIKLANVTDKDLWINVPDLATDDYVRRLATLMRDRLESGRRLYVEFSNEIWNGNYAATHRNYAAAQAEVAAGGSPLAWDGQQNPGYLAARRVAKRIKEIGDVFRSVYGDGAMMTRVRPVLASQAAQSSLLQQGLEFLDAVYGTPSRWIYAVSGAPYFGLRPEMSDRGDLGVDEIFAALPASVAASRTMTERYTMWARYYGLRNIAYEGGPHLVGETSLAAKIAANRDPRMGALILQNLREFREAGGDGFAYYTSIGAYSRYGMFGLVEDLAHLDTVKTRTVAEFLAGPPSALTAGFAVPGLVDAAAPLARNWVGAIVDDPAGGRFYLGSVAGGWCNYLVRVSEAGAARLIVQGARGAAGARLEVLVDARSLGVLDFPATATPLAWVDLPALAAELAPGLHTIRIRVVSPGANVKALRVE